MEDIEYRTVSISGIDLEYRKWKVKDKLELDKIDADLTADNIQKMIRKREVFVYNCLKERVPLDIEQYNYVLSLIREYSLHSPMEFTVECTHCKAKFLQSLSTPEIITFRDADYKDITVKDLTFKIGNVTDPGYDFDILNAMSTSERFLADFAYHVVSINDKEVSPTDVMEILGEFDVDDFQVLFDSYNNQKFVCGFSKAIVCPECGEGDIYEFDNLTAFFPKSWNV